MTYQETLDYMLEQLPMFHRIGKAAYKANLTTALALDKYYGHPHRKYKTIHVAGTNGKGSVSHMLAAVLQLSGYRTGLFTSPHLKDFRERIRVNGQMIPEDAVAAFISGGITVFGETKPSFFEMTSALAFEHFAREKVDVAVIEVGMGGRLDSTNIITPLVSVITNIGFDHTEFLGDTLAKIAAEKAGIIKPSTPVVIGEYNAETWLVFKAVAEDNKAPVMLASEMFNLRSTALTAEGKQAVTLSRQNIKAYERLDIDLLGNYQQKNICTVMASIEALRESGLSIPDAQVKEALGNVMRITGLQGRWQVLGRNPLKVCDTGHNIHGMTWVLEQIRQIPCKQLHMVLGFVNDKDVSGVLKLLPLNAKYYFTKASIPRALEAQIILQTATAMGLKGTAYDTIPLAMEAVTEQAGPEDFIFIGGSNFVVAEVL